MVLFWNSLLSDEAKLSSIMYRLMLNLHERNPIQFKWITYIKSIFFDTGLNYIWDDQIPFNKELLKSIISRQLNDQFIQQWFANMNNSSRSTFYFSFKTEFGLESYLTKLNESDRRSISKLRCSNLKIPIETGRWSNLPLQQRLCQFCTDSLGDEFHYIFVCQHQAIKNIRDQYIPNYYKNNPQEHKLVGLLRYCNVKLYKNLSIFIKKTSSYTVIAIFKIIICYM